MVGMGLQAQKVSSLRRQILQILRPNAISLVDSWAFTDYELNSALGRQDGDVYTALLSMAKGSPLNRTDEGAILHPCLTHATIVVSQILELQKQMFSRGSCLQVVCAARFMKILL
jgi:hypothetical protein